MEEKKRQTGIDVVGAVPWGTHLCLFYEVKQDLLDILVPYFKAGLENNEFCIWVTSEPLVKKEAEEAMRKAMPDFAQYLKGGQIEIIPHTGWYLKDGAFNLQRVLNAWMHNLNKALANGYDGLRLTGNTAWLEKENFGNFTDYEGEINSVIGDYRLLAICTYSLDKCGFGEIIDMVQSHQSVLIRRYGSWTFTGSAEYLRLQHDLTERNRAGEEMLQQNRLSENVLNSLVYPVYIMDANDYTIKIANVAAKIGNLSENLTCYAAVHKSNEPCVGVGLLCPVEEVKKTRKPVVVEHIHCGEDGSARNVEVHAYPIFNTEGDVIQVIEHCLDITKFKRVEEALQVTESELSAIYENAPIIMILVDQERRVRKVNYTAVKVAQRAAEEMIGLYGGEALRCIHSIDDPRGCGFGRFCEGCPVRRTVLNTFKTGNNQYRVRAELQLASGQGDVTVLVSTILLNLAEGQRVLVCIEDITELQRRSRKQQMASPLTSRGPLTPLQERFVKSYPLEDFTDREAIELLLDILPCGRDRQQKERILKAFKSIRGLLSASPQELEQAGFTPQCMLHIKLLREIPAKVLREKIIERPVFESSKEIFDYLYYSMRDLKKEVFKAIYLNSRNQIIDIVGLFEGTLESIPIRPREIVEGVIKQNAAAVIFVHNHPSGDLTPSKGDKRFTRDLVFMGNIIEVKVLDHIIIGGNRYFSFADEGLIAKYEDNFLNLKIRGVFDSGVGHRRHLHRVSTLHTN